MTAVVSNWCIFSFKNPIQLLVNPRELVFELNLLRRSIQLLIFHNTKRYPLREVR